MGILAGLGDAVDSLSGVDKYMITVTQMRVTLLNVCGAFVFWHVERHGTPEFRGFFCFVAGCMGIIWVIFGFAAIPVLEDLAPGSGGGNILFGIIFFILTVLLFLGADYPPQIKRVSPRKCLYWGFMFMIPFAFLWSLIFLANAEGYVDGSGIPLTDTGKKVLALIFRYNFGPTALSFVVFFFCFLLHESTHAAYGAARTLGIFFGINWVLHGLNKTVFESMSTSYFVRTGTNGDADADYGGVVASSFLSIALSWVAGLLFYGPVIYYDFWLKAAIEETIDGKVPEGKAAELAAGGENAM